MYWCLPPINRLQHLVVTLCFKHMMLAWFFSVFPFSDCQVWSGDTAELPKLIHFSSLSHVCVAWCHQRFIKWNEMQPLAVDLRTFKFLLPRVRDRCGVRGGVRGRLRDVAIINFDLWLEVTQEKQKIEPERTFPYLVQQTQNSIYNMKPENKSRVLKHSALLHKCFS